MAKGGHSSNNTVITTNVDKNIDTTTNNRYNNLTTTHETNNKTNTLNGDKVGGGDLTSTNTVNSGTAIYGL